MITIFTRKNANEYFNDWHHENPENETRAIANQLYGEQEIELANLD